MDDINESAQALLTRARKKLEMARVLSLKADRDKLLSAAEQLEQLAEQIERQDTQIAPPPPNTILSCVDDSLAFVFMLRASMCTEALPR